MFSEKRFCRNYKRRSPSPNIYYGVSVPNQRACIILTFETHPFPPIVVYTYQPAPVLDISSQLEQLQAMGFINDAENRRALTQSNGDLDNALELIISERENMNLD